jgi:hypothetical protein
VQNGIAQQVWRNDPTDGLLTVLGPTSLDGRYVSIEWQTTNVTVAVGPGVTTTAPEPSTFLFSVDTHTRYGELVFQAPVVKVIGWTSDDQLLYTVNNSRVSPDPPRDSLPLRFFNPVNHYTTVPFTQTVMPEATPDAYAWTTDHTMLLLPLDNQTHMSVALLNFGGSPRLRPLALPGQPLALAPDGRHIIFLPADGSSAPDDSAILHLKVFDTATGQVTPLAINDTRLPVGVSGFSNPRWSADGAQLAWHTYQFDQADYLLSAPLNGGPPHLWAAVPGQEVFLVGFSPDGQTLAALAQRNLPELGQNTLPSLAQYWLFQRQAGAAQPPAVGWGNSALWSPVNGKLLVGSPLGVSAVDPASGAYEWLGDWPNCQLSRPGGQ